MTSPSDRPEDRPAETRSVHARGWAWSEPRPRVPWLGLVLVLVGLAFLYGQLEPRVTSGHAVLLALGLFFLAALVLTGAQWAALAAAILAPWGLVRVVQDLGYLTGPGWEWVFIGAGFLALYLYGLVLPEHAHGWAVWPAALFLVVGSLQVAERTIPGFPAVGDYWLPVLLIVLGALLVYRSLARPRPPAGWPWG